ncbi:hypothetical protein P7C73_g5119, partial [Tremellales sp. Uapishka_1]
MPEGFTSVKTTILGQAPSSQASERFDKRSKAVCEAYRHQPNESEQELYLTTLVDTAARVKSSGKLMGDADQVDSAFLEASYSLHTPTWNDLRDDWRKEKDAPAVPSNAALTESPYEKAFPPLK